MGALTGLVLGVCPGPGPARPGEVPRVWAAAIPVLWALGWTVTTWPESTWTGSSPSSAPSAPSPSPPSPGCCCTGSCPSAPPTTAARRLERDQELTQHEYALRAHVIFGTGAIGLATLDALRRRGETVRLVNRSGSAPVPDDVEIVQGDASDPGFTTAVAEAPRSSTRPSPRPTTVGGGVPRPAGRRARRRPSHGRPAGQHGERLHVRPTGRPAPHRDPRLRGSHQEREAARPNGPRAARAHQAGRVEVAIGTGLGLLRPPRRRPVQPGRPASSPPPSPARPPPSWATPTSRTPTPTSPTSAKASPSSANTPTPPARSGTCPTTPTPVPPDSWSTSSTEQAGQPRTRLRRSARPAAARRADQPHRAGTGRAAVRVPGALHRRQQQDREQARRPRHPAGAGPGRHPGQLPPAPRPVEHRLGSIAKPTSRALGMF